MEWVENIDFQTLRRLTQHLLFNGTKQFVKSFQRYFFDSSEQNICTKNDLPN
jgi:hypothetical protein